MVHRFGQLIRLLDFFFTYAAGAFRTGEHVLLYTHFIYFFWWLYLDFYNLDLTTLPTKRITRNNNFALLQPTSLAEFYLQYDGNKYDDDDDDDDEHDVDLQFDINSINIFTQKHSRTSNGPGPDFKASGTSNAVSNQKMFMFHLLFWHWHLKQPHLQRQQHLQQHYSD